MITNLLGNNLSSKRLKTKLIFLKFPDTEEWKNKDHRDWTSMDVLHWIAHVAESHKFPYESVNASAFNVDGKTLLTLTRKDFVAYDEKYGNILYEVLHRSSKFQPSYLTSIFPIAWILRKPGVPSSESF